MFRCLVPALVQKQPVSKEKNTKNNKEPILENFIKIHFSFTRTTASKRKDVLEAVAS